MSNRKQLIAAAITFLLACAGSASGADKKEEKAPPPPVIAPTGEYNCEADVFYLWKKSPPPAPEGTPETGTVADTTPAAGTDELFARGRGAGASEAEARARLSQNILDLKTSAKKNCSDRHENEGSCISSRIMSLGSEYQKLDFETRRLLRDQYKEDCERTAGSCLGTRAGDITCEAPPSVAVEVVPDTAAEKDKKKK